ncbi:RHS repeat protein [Hymenobacter sp. DG01]|uniref:RHS repeat protein n=1 Tax=Hymenobacter sp. DG01 TaxID=2584940 RepID=UPI001122FA2B|nr:RHS repeat protein [Hymenobacter sp. DG01]
MFFRNRVLVRATASLLLLETVVNLVLPTLSYASMGPGQPEFTSYEAPGSTDMVNMTTGDFTFNIPVLDIPGPERSFSLPLTYRAGIRLEQEASWVGLGWSLNPGAIARGLNGYPDDAVNDPNTTTYKKTYAKGWTGGIPGVLDLAWDSNTGHSGTADLIGLASVGWENGKVNSGDLIGVKYTKGQGISVDPIRMAGAALTVASVGAAGSVSAGAAVAGKQLGQSVGTGVAMSMMLGKSGGSGGGFNRPIVKKEKRFLHTNYWVFSNDTKAEMMYGSLYFDNMGRAVKSNAPEQANHPTLFEGSTRISDANKPTTFEYFRRYGTDATETREVGADLQQYVGPKDDSYLATNLRPLSIAHDDFSVMGEGVSGSIRPFRMETGTLSFPKKMAEKHDKYNLVPFLGGYKPMFRYESALSNGYDYHSYAPNGVDEVGVEGSPNQNTISLTDQRLFSRSTSANRTAPARTGIVYSSNSPDEQLFLAKNPYETMRLVQGKRIKWYSNAEIESFYATSPDGNGNGFLEFAKPQTKAAVKRVRDRLATRDCPPPPPTKDLCQYCGNCETQYWIYKDSVYTTNNTFRKLMPRGSIGAFAITAEDGTTYHYSLPVYHYNQFSRSYELNPTEGDKGVSTQTIGQRGRDYGYATAWLLTAITSADYVDRGQRGLVDEQDWGGWVKFQYGRFSSRYKWRQPYVGQGYSESDMNTANFSEGAKQTYYLNSISTRTHTAFFIKSVRNDARGHFSQADSTQSSLAIDETSPSSSLRLDEIVLLNNQDVRKLEVTNGIRSANDIGPDIPAFRLSSNNGYDIAGNNATYKSELGNRDTYEFVLDQHDVQADSRIRNFLTERALKRILFNYSYTLCPGTSSSFPSLSDLPPMDEANASTKRTGKLTLESVSTYGPRNTKLIPDFVFTYGNNPSYDKDKWDGFGMYNSAGTYSNTTHNPSTNIATATQDGAAWSLTEVLNPLGSRMQIRYERDQYGSVSEFPTGKLTVRSDARTNVIQTPSGSTTDLTKYFKVGDFITLDGTISWRWGPCGSDRDTGIGSGDEAYTGTVQILSVSSSAITVSSAPQAPTTNGPNCPITVASFVGTVPVPENRPGGDIRVAAVITRDENNTASTVLYKYQHYGRPDATNSSGVISKLPEFITRQEQDFYSWFDYPATSVIYGSVSVLRGSFRNGDESDYDQREEFTFCTPRSSMVRQAASNTQTLTTTLSSSLQLERRINKTTVDVGMIAQPLSIRRYNRRGQEEFASTFAYANAVDNQYGIAGQGRFTEGVMTAELLEGNRYRVNRSVKEYVPTILTTTRTVANGIRTENTSTVFDFYTGQPLETVSRNSLGIAYRNVTVPAYMLNPFAAMGPAAQKHDNSNMLTQEAASYIYKQVGNGPWNVISASMQTWNNNWTAYRRYDESGTSDRYLEAANQGKNVWRQHASYEWNGIKLNPDGSYADFVDFNWSQLGVAGQNVNWLKNSEIMRYDVYSKVLESRDINRQASSKKYGYNGTQVLAASANAQYTEMAYSGAEDQVRFTNGSVHFGGEIRNGGTQSTDKYHTGLYSSKVQGVQEGFTYKALIGPEVIPGRRYRLSTWVHESDASRSGQLYAIIGSTLLGAATINSASAKKAGEWYLLNLYVTVPQGNTGQTLQVGCRNTGSGTVYFDDFRFHPLQAPLTAYVYDAHTGQPTHSLDNDNLYTRYEYDAAGQLVRVYKETLTQPGQTASAEKKIKEIQYNYARGLQ